MQKLSVDAGFSCPNRDGTLSTGGCLYCNNSSFSPAYCREAGSVARQLEEGKAFFGVKYPNMRYLAYFQSYTGTYGNRSRLIELYEEALAVEGVDGVIVGTRPDCVDIELLKDIARLHQCGFAMMEYGAETAHDSTLQRINRCHTWAQTVEAVEQTAALGVPVGLHFIMGLPGETCEDMLATIDAINQLPVDVVKFHQLQVVRGSRLAEMYAADAGCVNLWDVDSYVDFCAEIVGRLRSDIAIERFVSSAPANLLIAPRWGMKNYEFVNKLKAKLTS